MDVQSFDPEGTALPHDIVHVDPAMRLPRPKGVPIPVELTFALGPWIGEELEVA